MALAFEISSRHFRRNGLWNITDLTIPNLITLMRIVLVPIIIWALLSSHMVMAFIVFLTAGVSDAVDGAVARYFDQQTEFGTILDPIADKIMLVSVFIVLAYLDYIPLWFVILVVSRDLLIIFGVMLAYALQKQVTIRPLWVSKANTLAQIVVALYVLGALAFGFQFPNVKNGLVWITGVLTALSAFAYIVEGLKLFDTSEETGATGRSTRGEKL